jgi:nucleoside phosphorylase
MYILVMEKIDVGYMAESAVLDKIGELVEEWDKFLMVSYTPSAVLKSERNVPAKNTLREGLMKRLANHKESMLYFSSSGLETINETPKEEIDKFISLVNKNENSRALVLEDKDLPSVSIILGIKNRDNRGYGGKCDVFVEYRIGIVRESLFKTGTSLGGDDKVWIQYHLDEDHIPEPFKNLVNKLTMKQTESFEDWYIKNVHYEKPSILIISAMPDEVRPVINDLLKQKSIQQVNNRIMGTIETIDRKEIHCLIANVSYSRVSVATEITNILWAFPSIKYVFLIGVAGGGEGLAVGDVVISTSAENIYYENLLSESDYRVLNPKSNKIKIIDLSTIERPKLFLKANSLAAPLSERNKIDSAIGSLDVSLLQDTEMDKLKMFISKHHPGDESIDFVKENLHLNVKIWSSDHNINNKELKQNLYDAYETNVFDMESGGFLAALNEYRAFSNRDIGFGIVRGISDVSVEDRTNDRHNQRVAAVNALGFLEYFINTTIAKNLGGVNRE